MRERPILFTGPMVRAILNGRKTMTRRPVKPPLPDDPTKESGKRWGLVDDAFYFCGVRCPYGAPGDRLWVREAHAQVMPLASGRLEYPGARLVDGPDGPRELWFRADGEMGIAARLWDDHPRWTPGIHMPRWASRLTLEATEVRVERVQAITEEDARAEGFEPETRETWTAYDPATQGYPTFLAEPQSPPFENVRHHVAQTTARDRFEVAWRHMYGGTTFFWSDNPWVWVVSFRPAPSLSDAPEGDHNSNGKDGE